MSDVSLRDWDAERYHQVSEPQRAWGLRVLQRLDPVPGERILDLGCGTGRLTAELLERIGHGHVVGLDRSASMLSEAAARSSAHPPITPLHDAATRPGRLTFVQADGAALPFADAFDAVFSTATLHWILDHDAVFASVYGALAPGGRFIAQCGGGPNLQALLVRARVLMGSPDYSSYFERWREPWEFADVPTTMMRLERAGFTSVDVSLEPAPTSLPDRAAYADFIACVCLRPHLAYLPEAERPAFVDRIAQQAEADDVPFFLDYWRLNIAGRKPTVAELAA
jgi:trans-aconitate 2-methyltransferase